MDENLDPQRGIREYLLDLLEDPVMKSQIEEKLLTDDKSAGEITASEDALIEQYLDDELSPAERRRFLDHFLVAPQRQQQLRFHKNLRKYAVAQEPARAVAEEPSPGGWRRFFSMPALSYALVFVVVLGLGYGGWRIGFNRSNDIETAVAELRLAYKGQRPFASRIARFDYAPRVNERSESNKDPKKDPGDSAETLKALALVSLQKAVADKRTVESLYGLGKAYLAEKDFPQASRYMEEAAALAPVHPNRQSELITIADLQSDLGALYFEMSKKVPETEKAALLDKSLGSLERAIELDPKLPEPRFNRALVLQEKGSREQAEQAWREYVALDPNSKWTDEADRNLRRLAEATEDR